MKTHTSEFKAKIKEFGRELDSKITYTISGTTTELGNEQLNSVMPHYEGAILKSVMKQLDIDSNVEIPVGTELNYQLGIKTRSGKNLFNKDTAESGTFYDTTDGHVISSSVWSQSDYIEVDNNKKITISSGYSAVNNSYELTQFNSSKQWISSGQFSLDTAKTYTLNSNTKYVKLGFRNDRANIDIQIEVGNTATPYEPYGMYDYVDYGNYIVKDVEKQEDTYSYKITCYDKLLYTMKEYENSNIVFPITIRDYINAICNKFSLTFKNANDQFANYDKVINNELYLDNEGNSLGYTFRTVLDELAQVTASTICIDSEDKLEIRYINETVGKNLFNNKKKSDVGSEIITVLETGIRLTSITSSTYRWNEWLLPDDLLGKTVTITANISASASNVGAIRLYFSDSAGTPISTIGGAIKTSGSTTRYIPSTFPTGTSKIGVLLYANLDGTGSMGSYVDYTNLQIELGSENTSYEPYGDTIDEEYLKDVNVNFGEKFGPVNTIVLSRGGDGDKISLSSPTNLSDADKIAIQISDNQIMNGNDRNTYMTGILSKLYGLEYYINDFTSTGICYYDLCDKYNIKIDNKFYSCIMFNDNVEITQGLKEDIYTDMQEENEQDYKYMSSNDRGITQANIIAKKNEAIITEYTQKIDDNSNRLNAVETKQTETDRTINIMSTNIDANGNITEVTTTTGFTFNANGMEIHKSDSTFYAIHNETGTYYYDGGIEPSNIVGQYTKEGSKQKDLALFGVYYYGMDEIDDTPMFVAQLYTDENSEECFGHFYNRGD